MIDSYSSASDMIHATHEPINAEAENAVKAAPPAPLVVELSNPPPSAAKHHAMYTATGKNDPRAIAKDDFVLSKSNSFVMLGTIFWYVRLDRINGIAAEAAGPNPSGFVPGANSVPMGSDTFAKLGNNKLAKLENNTITATFAIFSRPWLVCVNDAIARMVAKPAATMVGSKPKPGRVFATRCPACDIPNAKKQLLIKRDAAPIAFPAASDFMAASAKSLNDAGTSHSDDSCSLIATSAKRKPEMRLYKYRPIKSADPFISPTPPTASGSTNIDEPTVLPVISSDADTTLVAASTVFGPGVGISNRPNNEATVLSTSSTESSVAASSSVLGTLLSPLLLLKDFSDWPSRRDRPLPSSLISIDEGCM
mmetsp:Transcript_385/g.658  ORF Transcript_385/g.658 Transcript_385/m.658 type:complete len:366 (-) Transcript_385:212-1309(-)